MAERWVVVIGRSNYRKPSQGVQGLLEYLRSLGFKIVFFESRRVQTSKYLDRMLDACGLARSDWLMRDDRMVSHLLRRLIKLMFLLVRPDRWDYCLPVSNPYRQTARELSRFMKSMPADQCWLLGHSAGAVAATMVADQLGVQAVIACSYPFKHPDKPDEAMRTKHLAGLRTPCLILQGNRDPYGNGATARARYALSDWIRWLDIESDHDFDGFHRDTGQATVRLLDELKGCCPTEQKEL